MSLIIINTIGLACPLPLLRLKQGLHGLAIHSQITLIADDPMSLRDIPRYCELSGHALRDQRSEGKNFIFTLEKML